MRASEDTRDIREVLGLDQAPLGRTGMKFGALVLLLVAIVASVVWFAATRNSGAVQYKTAPIIRGDLTVVVTAMGTLQPINQVDVGTEISGTISVVNVDYNDQVKAGQVLARIDTDKLSAQVRQSQSTLESSQARLMEAQASVIEARDNLERFKRVRRNERWQGSVTKRIRRRGSHAQACAFV